MAERQVDLVRRAVRNVLVALQMPDIDGIKRLGPSRLLYK